tara:strand:+ start:57012 stop:57461 length:450 start_codon:yes stop_codon:yes gene_type:complete
MLRSFHSFSLAAIGAWLIVSMALVAGCTDNKELSEAEVAALELRVAERWQALAARDFEKAWEYTTPLYRASFPKHLYVKKFSYAVEWELTAVEVVNYDARAAVASVVVRVMSKPTKQTSAASIAVGPIPSNLRERWIFTDGEWWFSANY